LWIRDASSGVVNFKCYAYLSLWDALKAAEIEIPYPKLDIYVKSAPFGPTQSSETATEDGQ